MLIAGELHLTLPVYGYLGVNYAIFTLQVPCAESRCHMDGEERVVHIVLHLMQQLSVCCAWQTTRHFYLQP